MASLRDSACLTLRLDDRKFSDFYKDQCLIFRFIFVACDTAYPKKNIEIIRRKLQGKRYEDGLHNHDDIRPLQ